MAPKLGCVPWNKNIRKDKIVTCATCNKKIQTRYDGQIYCNQKCYANSEKLKKTSQKSFLIISNKSKKWRKGTAGKGFTNKKDNFTLNYLHHEHR